VSVWDHNDVQIGPILSRPLDGAGPSVATRPPLFPSSSLSRHILPTVSPLRLSLHLLASLRSLRRTLLSTFTGVSFVNVHARCPGACTRTSATRRIRRASGCTSVLRLCLRVSCLYTFALLFCGIRTALSGLLKQRRRMRALGRKRPRSAHKSLWADRPSASQRVAAAASSSAPTQSNPLINLQRVVSDQ
jgi:hypothetical protein